MPPASQSPQQQGDNSLAPFWIIVGIFAVGWAVWTFAHEQIAFVILHIKLAEAELIGLFTNDGGAIAQTIRAMHPADVNFTDIADMSKAVGNYLRYPTIIIMCLLAIALYFSNPTMRYKKNYNMQRLVDEEKISWPQIMPVAGLDLVNTDIDTGPWAMGLTPMLFAKRYNLLQEERTVSSVGTAAQMRPKITVSLRREEAHRVFALQVGRYWTGAEHLNPHTRALFAIFAARAGRDRDAAQKLLTQISASVATGKLDFSGADELLKKYKDLRDVKRVTERHAFVLTTMASLLVLARGDGVLATADFLWLKPVDRPLWYMLNSVGRQTPFVEVGGPFAHWLAEKSLERKLSVPMVEEAVNALEIAIKEVIYIPDEE